MYLPKIYENFSEKYPEVFKNFKQLGIICRDAGPLDELKARYGDVQEAEGFTNSLTMLPSIIFKPKRLGL